MPEKRGSAGVWFTYSSLAVYDAVNAITGQYRPFYYQIAGPPDASVDVAAAVAAHRILVNYFPAQQAALDAQLSASLANIVASGTAREEGTTVGEGAASALISARTGDGLEANVPYVPGSGPGAWIPTPPAFAPPVTPWLGQMRPFTMRSAGDFLPAAPPSLDSETWKRDYNLTRLYGDVNSTIPCVRDCRCLREGNCGRRNGLIAARHDSRGAAHESPPSGDRT